MDIGSKLHFNFLILVLDGVLLLENPKGDNTLNFTGLVDAVSCIFGLKNSKLTVFNGNTGKWSMTRKIESLSRSHLLYNYLLCNLYLSS